MTQAPRTKFSVQQLISILNNPRSKTAPKRKQPILDRQQIRKQMHTKWKEPGFSSIQFSKAPTMRGQLLNQWQLQRIALAQRSYITPKNSKPYQFDNQSRQFPKVGIKSYPKKFQRYLKQIESQKQDLLFKQKRTITQGISQFHSLSKENNKIRIFKPSSTSTNVFGFTNIKSMTIKSKNTHFKTLNL